MANRTTVDKINDINPKISYNSYCKYLFVDVLGSLNNFKPIQVRMKA